MYAIEFNNVWKKFKRGEKVYALRDSIPLLAKNLFKRKRTADELAKGEFWATKDVSFKVKKGEVLGIIGPNGAGKSTILKLLSRVTRPTHGEFMVHGRLSALIEITAGFHPDFTGRENIYFNGAILGMTKKEIDEKFDEIVDFSGVGDFIDTPVKRYSSGMYARLGFSVAAHVDPDVLLVDEVLSVGDMTFQAKCTQKMRELLHSGVTIILISHNISLVQNLCGRVILLDKGQILEEGLPDDVIPAYENLVNQQREEELKKGTIQGGYRVDIKDDSLVKILGVTIRDANNNEKENFQSDEPITVDIEYDSKGKIENPTFVFEIVRPDGILCCCCNSKDDGLGVKEISGKGSIALDLGVTNLSPGTYAAKVSVWDKELVHPYVISKKGIFKIETKARHSYADSIFVLNSKWKVKKE